jgi:hypothetical protein
VRESYTALIPHPNVIAALAREQADLIASLSGEGGLFFRFLPLALFLPGSLEEEARRFESAPPPALLPPVYDSGLAVYPVRMGQDSPLLAPSFLPLRSPRLPCGIISVFAPHPARPPENSSAQVIPIGAGLGIPERKLRVFSLCSVEFTSPGGFRWEWEITRERWQKIFIKKKKPGP